MAQDASDRAIVVAEGTSLEGDLTALRATLAGRGEDGYLMRTVGERLVLTGNSPRTTLYAVYHFLEKYLGCGWCVPGEDTVPRREVVQVAALDEAVGPPAFSMRQIIVYPCGEAGITVQGPTCIYALSRAHGWPSGLETLQEGEAVESLTRPAAIRLEDENLAGEPNVEIASTWWPDIENTWVPIGWKDHPLRFNVLYNGTVIAQPVRYPARGQGVQLTFQLSRDGAVPIGNSTKPFQLRAQDGGVGDQGWSDQAAPVLWTRWRQDNLILRQEVFAHMPGGGPVTTGFEPLFAWIRLSLEPSSSGGAFALVRINQPHIQTAMDRCENLLMDPAASAYPRPLRLESAASRTSHMLLDDTEHVRLAIASSEQASVAFIDQRPVGADTYLKIAIPAGTESTWTCSCLWFLQNVKSWWPSWRSDVMRPCARRIATGPWPFPPHRRWIRRSHWSMQRRASGEVL